MNRRRLMAIAVRLLELRDASGRTLEDAARYKPKDVSDDPVAKTIRAAVFRRQGRETAPTSNLKPGPLNGGWPGQGRIAGQKSAIQHEIDSDGDLLVTLKIKGPDRVGLALDLIGSPGRTRTADRVVNSHLLYQLSYRGSG